jgi:REase_DpnII-MboI
MEPVVLMSMLVLSASASLINAASAVLDAPSSWPEPATGLACRIFERAGMPASPLMLQPLRQTSGALLRRTPEIAAFGYVLDRADTDTLALWNEAIEHLRGREIYPADRQSFIFNPIEILGVAAGVLQPSVPAEHSEWLAGTILRGLTQGQFRTPLSRLAAHAALIAVDDAAGRKQPAVVLDVQGLGTADLTLAAAIYLTFGGPTAGEDARIEQTLMARALTQPIPIGDAAEAAALVVLANRAAERAALASDEISPEERIVALCRRFPLFVDRLQDRQRSRPTFAVDDEYDVQDLLHAILKLHFDDVRPEEYTPSYAGNASRVDFYLPRERIAVEAKMTRPNLGQKEVANQLVVDIARYAQMPTVDTLICLIYDPGRRCDNPRTLENDLEASVGRLKVRVIVCPQGL